MLRYISVIIATSIIYILLTRLGIGNHFPIQDFDSQVPLLPSSSLEIVATLPMPPGNVAVSSKGIVYFNFHPEYNPYIKIARLSSNGKNGNYSSWEAFPSISFQKEIISCLSLRIDKLDRLWLLDYAHHGTQGRPRLIAFDVSKNFEKQHKQQQQKNSSSYSEQRPIHDYSFPSSVAGYGSMLNDFQIDPRAEYIYIVDTSIVGMSPAIVVYHIESRTSYRFLNKHPALMGMSVFLNVSDVMIGVGPLGLTVNADSLALDRSGEMLYVGAVTHTNLYTIPTLPMRDYIQLAVTQAVTLDTLGNTCHVTTNTQPTVDKAGTSTCHNHSHSSTVQNRTSE